MTQQPFSRPGAVDLSGLAQSAPGAPGAPGAAGGDRLGSAYAVELDEQNFQSVLEESRVAPVVLLFHSATQAPQSSAMASDLVTVADEFEGRFLAALVDVDQVPQIAQAMQIQQVPLMMVLLDGRPATQPMPGQLSIDDLRTLFNQLGQQLTQQGIVDRHQPRSQGDPEEGPAADPRYAPAQDALKAGDVDLAVAEYQKLVDANPADAEASAGLAMAKVLQRTQGVDLNSARTAAADNPDDIDAQTLVADLDMLGGHVDDAFNRLVDLVRRTTGEDRDRVRNHLVGLFAAVGNADERVIRGRQNLASALF